MTITRWLAPFALLFVSHLARASSGEARCLNVPRDYARRSVIVFAPPSTFTICRDGAAQDDVIAGRAVYLMLDEAAPTFEFQVHGRAAEPGPSGLGELRQQAARVAAGLADLEASSETIAELEPPSNAPLRPVAAARLRYLGVATPGFHEILAGLSDELPALVKIARALSRWCGELSTSSLAPATMAHLGERCGDESARDAKVASEVAALTAARHRFHELRSKAREALVDADADPGNADRQTAATRALDEARVAALAVVEAAAPLLPIARALTADATLLRHLVHTAGALRPHRVVYLATYAHAGNAILELDVHPTGLAMTGIDPQQETGSLTYRFAIVDTHYVDVEFGVGITGATPDQPILATQNGMTVIQGRPLDEFVALALLALEPARFFAVDKPWAGLLRLPVLGIPLSENPTQNFFIGAGLGWTGVGSISAGPYIVRATTLRPGLSEGQAVPIGSSYPGITRTTVQTGYFVSASVDLLGLYHLIVPRHLRTFDAATGVEHK